MLLNNYIKVKELTDNLTFDGMLEKYDDTSPYMFCKILDLDSEVLDKLTSKVDFKGNKFETHNLFNNAVLVVKRVTKIRGFNGLYIQLSDVIEIIPKDEYQKYVYE